MPKKTKEKRLITVALPYTNNVPHAGTIVGSHLPGDIFARYCKLAGYDAILIGGTDEHGTPITVEAQKYGITPQELADKFFKIHKDIYDWFNIDYDNFSRTSKPIHHKTAQDFILKLYKKGFLSEEIIKIPFCDSCKQALPDRYIQGTCPYCGYDSARGDQCEKCSNLMDPVELKNPYCVICKSYDIKFLDKKHLFFRLDKLSNKLESWIKKNKTWRKNVKSIALGWIKEGLKPRDITRDMNWGVKIPIKGYESSVIYVWGEAAIGYISSTKEWDKNKWKDYWKNKNSKIYHFLGKDNIPFHTLLFPAELMAYGGFNLPYNVVGLQYLNYEGGKFSKSKGYGVFCENLPKAGLSSDYWRFYLSFIIPETKDSEFLWRDFQERINSDLIGNFGNFVNRTLSFSYKNFNKKIPKIEIKDKGIYKNIIKQIDEIINLFEKVELRQALEKILGLSDFGNKYFQSKEPWRTKDKEVIFICANLCKILALLIQPYLPESSKKILDILNCKEKNWEHLKEFNLINHEIREPKILFQKIEDSQINELKEKTSKVTQFFNMDKQSKINKPEKSEKLEGIATMSEIVQYNDVRNAHKNRISEHPENPKELVDFPCWEKLELRVGKIIKIEDIEGADKLYKLEVDLGKEKRTVCAGLKKFYTKPELINKRCILFVNLAPRIMRGIESKGMILAAVSEDESQVKLIQPDSDIALGSRVR